MTNQKRVGKDQKTILRRDSHISLYKQLADRLIEQIESGAYAPFDKLPTETEMMRTYNVSRITVRQAIDALIRRKLAVRKQGKGTFVIGKLVTHDTRSIGGIYDTLASKGLAPETELLEFKPAASAPSRVMRALGPRAGGKAMFLKRLYSRNGKKFGILIAWFPPPKRVISKVQARSNTVYSILENLLGQNVARAEVSVSAQAAKSLAKSLGCSPRDPLLVMERTSYGSDGIPLEFTQFYVQAEGHSFQVGVSGSLPLISKIAGDR